MQNDATKTDVETDSITNGTLLGEIIDRAGKLAASAESFIEATADGLHFELDKMLNNPFPSGTQWEVGFKAGYERAVHEIKTQIVGNQPTSDGGTSDVKTNGGTADQTNADVPNANAGESKTLSNPLPS